ncbi:MAG TPA: ribonuclease E/G [Rhodospirillaceae bacterium]|nr:MAG: hypothetical protein A2018_00745 [Alphaproteobacteria bacterium GWF2_58_20]HAU28651.1 ribonuclease E/G [Rhodospirillaceae bacterium]
MSQIMLIDATQSEETRVAIVDAQRLEEFDFETAAKKQIKGNIYLARVTRVEPSLQAAFVEYGGNRHAFLPLAEIHPDYYQIPASDREKVPSTREKAAVQEMPEVTAPLPSTEDVPEGKGVETSKSEQEQPEAVPAAEADVETSEDVENRGDETPAAPLAEGEAPQQVDVVGGDLSDDMRRARRSQRRNYQIQEVIKRRQIMLIQVTKEERGSKGAAITTYLSLAGRYCVLMPNTADGGGVSRKISNPTDRRRMKDLIADLKVPDGMSVILRTAGIERNKTEIRRDLDYLLRLWDSIRELTFESIAPVLVHEEGNIVKRAIRDLYQRDMEAVEVAGEEAYKTAKDFMKMLIPSHARKVRLYKDDAQPLFARYRVEEQIDAIHNPMVHLPSGGSIVINSTEALVAIDVNSGRATRERHIEDTALKTNLEAADEISRQLRLRDLGGLVVIDFIDMDESRHNAAVERRMKEVMKGDRARIQIGRISPFGLLEMSRQRLRPSLIETHFECCPICRGIGVVRSIEASALSVLRAIEQEGVEGRFGEIVIKTPSEVCLYLLNQKRAMLAAIETRYTMLVRLLPEASLFRPAFEVERLQRRAVEMRPQPALPVHPVADEPIVDEEADEVDVVEAVDNKPVEPRKDNAQKPAEDGERRRRRGRRGGRRRGQGTPREESSQGKTVMPLDAPQPELKDVSNPAEKKAEGPSDKRRGRRNSGRKPESRPQQDGAPKATPVVRDAAEKPADHSHRGHGHVEKVNETDGQPKQGWWKKLMG